MQRLQKRINERETAQVNLLHPQESFAVPLSVPVCHNWTLVFMLTLISAVQASETELENLESQLNVNDILLFRTMAERKAQEPKVSLDVVREPFTEGIQEGTDVM